MGKEWSPLQRAGAHSEKSQTNPKASKQSATTAISKDAPMTVVIYSEISAKSARIMADFCGFDPAQTLVLLDEPMAVTEGTYKAETCPRVFVVDSKGVLRYTNNSKDDAPREAPALMIVSRALDALRSSAPARKDSGNTESTKPSTTKGSNNKPASIARLRIAFAFGRSGVCSYGSCRRTRRT